MRNKHCYYFTSFGSPFCSKLGPLEIVEQCNGQRWETMGKWISESISESQGRRGLLERLVHLKLEKSCNSLAKAALVRFAPGNVWGKWFWPKHHMSARSRLCSVSVAHKQSHQQTSTSSSSQSLTVYIIDHHHKLQCHLVVSVVY